MNIAELALASLRRAPNSVKGLAVFTDTTTGDTSTGTALGVAARPSQADGFKAGVEVTEKARKLTVLPDGMAFAPSPGMRCVWAGTGYTVLSSKPFPEDVPAFYTVVVSR